LNRVQQFCDTRSEQGRGQGSISSASDFAPFRFSTDDLPERTRVEALQDIYARTIINHDIAPWRDNPIHFTLTLSRLPDLGLAAGVGSPVIAERTTKHLLGDDLVLNVTLRGARTLCQRGREADVREGEAVVGTSADAGVTTIQSPSRFVSVRLPRLRLAPLMADLDAVLVRTIRADTPALRLLVGYVHMLQDTKSIATTETARLVATHVHDLAALVMGATRDAAVAAQRRGVRAARLEAIKSDIIAHLDQPDLSVTTVAARHDVSPRMSRCCSRQRA
jgi:AraC-binding-like domain